MVTLLSEAGFRAELAEAFLLQIKADLPELTRTCNAAQAFGVMSGPNKAAADRVDFEL